MIKKGIKVKVLAGKDKKKEGEVIQIDRSNNRAKVKDTNIVKKHVKTTKEKKGGIVSKENLGLRDKLVKFAQELSKKHPNTDPNEKILKSTWSILLLSTCEIFISKLNIIELKTFAKLHIYN